MTISIQLHVTQPDKEVETTLLDEGVFTIGRSMENEVAIPHDTISRIHAEITVTETSVSLKNLQEKTKILVDGNPYTDDSPIENGSIILLGLVKIELDAPYLEKIQKPVDDNTRILSEAELAAALDEIKSTSDTQILDKKDIDKALEDIEISEPDADIDLQDDATMLLEDGPYTPDQEMKPGKLIQLAPKTSETFEHVIYEGDSVIGRDPGCNIVLEDKKVSRKHAMITLGEHGAVLKDMDSYNGIKVNDTLIIGTYNLEGGEEIAIGDYIYSFVAPSIEEVPVETPSASIPEQSPVKASSGGIKQLIAKFTNLEPRRKLIVVLGALTAGLCIFALIPAGTSKKESVVSAPVQKEKQETQEVISSAEPETSEVNQTNIQLDSYFAKAKQYADNELWDQARALLTEIENEDPNYPGLSSLQQRVEDEVNNQTSFLKGQNYLQQGNSEEAIALFEAIPENSSYFEVAQKKLSQIQTQSQKKKEEVAQQPAQQQAETVVAQPKVNPVESVITLYYNGQFENALASARKLGGGQGKNAENTISDLLSKYNSGKEKYQKNQVTAAFQLWDEVIKKDRSFTQRRGSKLTRQIKSTKANHYHRISEKALLNKSYKKANTYCIKAINEIRNHKGALDIAEKLNNNAKKVYEKGYILEDLQHDKALKLWKEVLEITPPFTDYYKKAKKALKKY